MKANKYYHIIMIGISAVFSVVSAYFFGTIPYTNEILLLKQNEISNADEWSLPYILPDLNLDNSYKILKDLKPWGYAGEGLKISQNEKGYKWRLKGVVQVLDNDMNIKWFALIETGNKIRRYIKDDVLPSNELIKSIEKNSIEVLLKENNRIIKLYKK